MSATDDLLGRSKRQQATLEKRYEDFHAQIGTSDLSLKNACFRVAAFEVLTEEQWQTVLKRTKQLIEFTRAEK